jgi:hypothetical protein
VEPPNALMAKLDAFRWEPRKVLPDGAWQAWCGPATHDFLKQVNAEAAAITKEPEGPFNLLHESSGSLAFFSLLDRTVEFQRAFSRSSKIPMKFRTNDGEHPVQFFAVRDEAGEGSGDSVRILAWRPIDRSHAIQIRCKQADDTVIHHSPPLPLRPPVLRLPLARAGRVAVFRRLDRRCLHPQGVSLTYEPAPRPASHPSP